MFSKTSQRIACLKSRSYSTSASTFNVTKLSNGVRVATARNQDAVATVGVVVNAGSRFENSSNLGTTGALRRIAFKSTQNVSELRLAREFELLGANYTVGVGKEQIVYTSEVTADKVSKVLPLLAEVLSPRAAEYEVRFSRAAIQADTENAESDATTLLLELVHREAYRSKGLGQSAYTPSYRVKRITDKVIQEYVQQHYTNDRLVVVATGDVDHSQLVQQVEQLLGARSSNSSSSSSSNTTAKTEYVGGELKVPGDFPTHLAIAFEGVSHNNTGDYFAAAVLKSVLGGGQNVVFQAPGYGRVSRLGRNVVEPNNSWVAQANAFNLSYADSGLFGVHAVASKTGHAGQLANAVTKELKAVSQSAVSEEELNRAKETVRAHTLFANETRNGFLEFVANQVTSSGGNNTLKSPAEYLAGVNAVTAQQVQALAKKLFQSPPTVVALGDIVDVPSSDAVKKSLH